MNINWRIAKALNHLAVFEVAVDLGGFTQAAKALGTTQPSVSRHIAALEGLLNIQLFYRLHHRVELTPEGIELHRAVKLGLDHIRQAVNQIVTPVVPGMMSVGCTYGFAHLWLMPRFSALQKLVPDQELRMVTSDTRTIFDLKDVDFAVRFGHGQWTDGTSSKLFTEELFPVCSPDFWATHFKDGGTIDPISLTALPLIHEREIETSWMVWRQWFGHFGINYAPEATTYFFDNYAMTLQAAMEGRGIALAWQNLAEEPLKSGHLIEIPRLRVASKNGYYLACRSNHPQAKKVVGWFKDMAKRQGTAA